MRFSRLIALSLTLLSLLSRGVVSQDVARRDLFIETDHCDCQGEEGIICADVSPDRFDECAPDLFIRLNENTDYDFECDENQFNCTYEDIPISDECFDVRIWDLDPGDSDEGPVNENADFLGRQQMVCFGMQTTEWVLPFRGRTTIIRAILFLLTTTTETTTTETTTTETTTTQQGTTTTTTGDGTTTTTTVLGGTTTDDPDNPAPTPSETGAAAVDGANDTSGSTSGAAVVGPIAGGIAGAVAVLLAIFVLCMWYRKRKKTQPQKQLVTSSSSLHEVAISDPLPTGPSAPRAETPSVKKGPRNASGTVSLSSVYTSSSSSGSIPLKPRTEALELKSSIPEEKALARDLTRDLTRNLTRPDQPDSPPPPPPVLLAGTSKSSRRQLFQAPTSQQELVENHLARERITNAQLREIWDKTASRATATESEVRKVAAKVIDEMDTRVVSLLKNFKQIDHHLAQGFFEECHKRPVDRLVTNLKKETSNSKLFTYGEFESATNKVLLNHMEKGVSTLIVHSTDVGTKHR